MRFNLADPPVLPAINSPIPPKATDTYGPLVRDWARRRINVELDDWQAYALDRALVHDKDGSLIVRQALLSTGRQNGKTVIVRSFVGWMLDEGRKLPAFRTWQAMLAAAHDAGQARIVYDSVRRDLVDMYGQTTRKQLKDIRITTFFGIDVEGMKFDIATSQPGSARGLSVGALVWDEVLTQKNWMMYEALGPTQSAQLNPIAILTSTAGYNDSVVLRALHDRGIRQVDGAEKFDPSFMMLWWRADHDDVGLEWDQIRKANPTIDGGRLSRKAVESEFAILPKSSWTRERLNRFADSRTEVVVSPVAWANTRVQEPLLNVKGPFTLAVEVSADWQEASIVVAAVRPDGRVGVEVHRTIRGTVAHPVEGAHIIREIQAFCDRWPVTSVLHTSTSPISMHAARHAATSAVVYDMVQNNRVARMCGDFLESIASKRIAHDDPLLDVQIGWAGKRDVGSEGQWRWALGASGGYITSVMAATLAVSTAAAGSRPIQLW